MSGLERRMIRFLTVNESMEVALSWYYQVNIDLKNVNNNVGSILCSSLIWKETKEGYKFWESIHDKYNKTDLPSYL